MVPETIVVHATAPAQVSPRASRFHQFLSELNPLQYLPVVGTLYRAITGDTIPERARIVGSMVVSGLMGGPIGVALNVASLAAEKITGIDPERLGSTLLADIGIGATHEGARPGGARHGGAKPEGAAPTPSVKPPAEPPVATPWSQTQLAAYGITTTPDGTLHHGTLSGSDVLNDLELARTA